MAEDKKNLNLPDENELADLAELFKVFGDSSRIKILYALFGQELGVGDIAETINMTISAVSHQLKILKTNHLVKSRRSGKNIIYSLDDDHVYRILAMGREHIEE
jgi:ArsR family transcriptional regulator